MVLIQSNRKRQNWKHWNTFSSKNYLHNHFLSIFRGCTVQKINLLMCGIWRQFQAHLQWFRFSFLCLCLCSFFSILFLCLCSSFSFLFICLCSFFCFVFFSLPVSSSVCLSVGISGVHQTHKSEAKDLHGTKKRERGHRKRKRKKERK